MHRKALIFILSVLTVFALQACSGGGGGGTGQIPTGTVQLSLTDAPGDYDHVWITVKEAWFHTSDSSGPLDAGWHKFPLSVPVTVDLLSLSNGNISNSPVWGNISLPEGSYQQLRLILAGTEDAKTASAAALDFNNEVDIGSGKFPLRIPDAHHGIRLTGDFHVTAGGTLKLAIDFDAGHDVVEIQRNGNKEYVLKPRLGYFDLDNAGAIIGSIDPGSAATNTTSRFVVKAEQVDDPVNPQFHVVKRATIINQANGKFIFYPVKPGTYDIVIRGIGYQTVIIKGVPVTQGTTPLNGATTIPTVNMTTGSDYSVGGTIASPTGAWAEFYQTLRGAGEVPYEIRFRHFNPLTGQFTGFPLSSDQLWVASYASSTQLLGPTATSPVGGNGTFSAVASAILYDRSAPQLVSFLTTTSVSFPALSPKSLPSVVGGNSIMGAITVPTMMNMNKGILFAVHGGMIVNTIDVSSMMASGGTYTMPSLPGGTSTNPMPLAFYGVEALGWSTTFPFDKTVDIGIADLRTGNASGVDMNMLPF